MASSTKDFTIWGFIKGFGKLLIGFFLILQGVIGLAVFLIFLGLISNALNDFSGDAATVRVPEGAALVLDPEGALVEEAEVVDPFTEALEEATGGSPDTQIEVHDIVRALRKAKDDDRIKALVLDIGRLTVPSSSASKLHYLADELDAFKESGKKIIAVGDSYSQAQYILAARADEILMNDFGAVAFLGYGRYQTYLKSFLENLKVTSHVFRVGTFKSAVEPFLRNDMSSEAREANLAYLNVLWDAYAASIETARGLSSGAAKTYADDLPAILRRSGGNFAQAALDYGLVDRLESRQAQLAYLKETFGEDKDGKSFKSVSFDRYLEAVGEPEDGAAPNVAIVTVAGAIVDGEQPAGVAAGGETIAAYLKKALEDDNVKAVVLRVDSPGGSVFASELIRDGVLALKQAGKPVVASMGSLAASGGYWVSAPADEIWAAPTTITGSIGIFGFFTTFENTANEIGVSIDGVGTSALSPLLATGLGPLPENAADLFQQSIEDGYDRFLNVVGQGRGLDPSYVDSVGQGRVWIGARAQQLSLVDNLGSFDDAVAAAARLADLETYDRVEMVEKLTPIERFFGRAGAQALAMAGLLGEDRMARGGVMRKLVARAEAHFAFLEEFNDPNAAYARCLACSDRQ